MGTRFADAYSLLHFAVGVIARHWNVSFWLLTIIHIVFEVAENTATGMRLINHYITMWPGGKPEADSVLNSVGDTVFSAIGWVAADQLLR
jgi:hypothetical protein